MTRNCAVLLSRRLPHPAPMKTANNTEDESQARRNFVLQYQLWFIRNSGIHEIGCAAEAETMLRLLPSEPQPMPHGYRHSPIDLRRLQCPLRRNHVGITQAISSYRVGQLNS